MTDFRKGIPVPKNIFRMHLEASLATMVATFEEAYEVVGLSDKSAIYAFEKAFRNMIKEFEDASNRSRREEPDSRGS